MYSWRMFSDNWTQKSQYMCICRCDNLYFERKYLFFLFFLGIFRVHDYIIILLISKWKACIWCTFHVIEYIKHIVSAFDSVILRIGLLSVNKVFTLFTFNILFLGQKLVSGHILGCWMSKAVCQKCQKNKEKCYFFIVRWFLTLSRWSCEIKF